MNQIMRHVIFSTLLLGGVCFLSGCGESPVPETPENPAHGIGPHGGTAYRLPDETGYVELINEPEVDLRSETPTALVAYFLQTDVETPLSPSPSDVKLELEAGQLTRTIALEPSPGTGDPAGSTRFASEPGPYNLADIRGNLTGQLGGQPFEVTIEGRR